MTELLLRTSRNVSSDLVSPAKNSTLTFRSSQPSMFISGSSKRIRPTQTRRPRITLQAYYDFTDVRSINFHNGNGFNNSSSNFSRIKPEKLVERSRDLRLGITQANRSSMISSHINLNQPSSLWPNFHSNSLTPTTNRSNIVPMPDISHRTSRAQSLSRTGIIDRQISPSPIESKSKTYSKTKINQNKITPRLVGQSKSPFVTPRVSQPMIIKEIAQPPANKLVDIHICQSEEQDENNDQQAALVDDYLTKAMSKCADWLIKYVFDQKFEYVEEVNFE